MHPAENANSLAQRAAATGNRLSNFLSSWSYGLIGFERPRPRKMKAECEVPGPHHPFLGDYADFAALSCEDDGEAEHSTWPELFDQTRLARFCGQWDFDDMEEDDPPGGDVVDEPHDAREEDGI